MKDILNSRVKHRQPFRPFAPLVLEERSDEIFLGPGDSPYMLMAKQVHPDWKDKIRRWCMSTAPRGCRQCDLKSKPAALPAAQGVRGAHRCSGAGQHLVQHQGRSRSSRRPQDALECFLGTGIDYLILHGIVHVEDRASQGAVAGDRRLFGCQIHRAERACRRGVNSRQKRYGSSRLLWPYPEPKFSAQIAERYASRTSTFTSCRAMGPLGTAGPLSVMVGLLFVV